MKLLIPILSIIGASLVFFACRGSRGGLSGAVPADFELRYWEDGGMLPQGKNYRINRDSIWVESWYQSSRNTWQFAVDSTRLDSLWKSLGDHQAQRITFYEEMVYDRGGNGFSFMANGEKFEVNNSGMRFVDRRWVQDFQAIIASIQQTVNPGLKKYQVDYEVVLNGTPPDSVSEFYLSLDDATLFSWNRTKGDSIGAITQVFQQLSGQYQLEIWAKVDGKHSSNTLAIRLAMGSKPVYTLSWQENEPILTAEE